MIYENLGKQNKRLFQREEFAFEHEKTCLHNFSFHYETCQFRGSSMSVHRSFSFFFRQSLEQFLKNKEVFRCFFFFEGGTCIWQKKFWPIKYLIIITTQPIVFLLGFASYFGDYSLNNIINLRNRQVLFKKLASEKKPVFPTKKLGSCLPFWQI